VAGADARSKRSHEVERPLTAWRRTSLRSSHASASRPRCIRDHRARNRTNGPFLDHDDGPLKTYASPVGATRLKKLRVFLATFALVSRFPTFARGSKFSYFADLVPVPAVTQRRGRSQMQRVEPRRSTDRRRPPTAPVVRAHVAGTIVLCPCVASRSYATATTCSRLAYVSRVFPGPLPRKLRS